MVKKLFSKIADKIIRFPKVVILLVIVMTLLLSIGLPKIQMKMGNDVFIDTSSSIYKNTEIYQKNFGGDSAYFIISSKNKNNLINHQNFKKIAKLESEIGQEGHVNKTTSVISLMNQILKSKSSMSLMNSSEMSQSKRNNIQKEIMANISSKDKTELQNELVRSFSTEQNQELQKYVLSILTDEQKNQLQESNNDSNSLSILNTNQQNQTQSYAVSLLTTKQQQDFSQRLLTKLPSVENLTTKLLQYLLIDENGKINSKMSQLLPKDGASLIIMASLKNSDMDSSVAFSKNVNKVLKSTKISNTEIRYGGQPAILGGIKDKVMNTMAIMLVLAVVLMMIILFMVFKVRRKLLSLLFVMIGLLWTFGFMGWANISLTLATMATLPILIGLGTDFGVQFHNRYEEEYRRHLDSSKAVKTAIVLMGPAVGTALIVMVFAFLTMYLSKAPMMQQFGLTLAVGVVNVYISEFLLIFTTFSLLDKDNPKIHSMSNENSKIEKLITSWANFVSRHASIVLVIALILGGLGFAFEKNVAIETDITKMIPQNMKGLQDTKYLQNQVGSTNYITYLVKGEDVTNKTSLIEVQDFAKNETTKYKDVASFNTLGSTYSELYGNIKNQNQNVITENINNLPKALKSQVVTNNSKYAAIQFKVNKDLSSAEQNKLMKKINQDTKTTQNITISPAGSQDMLLVGIDNLSSNRELMMISGLLVIIIVLFIVYKKIGQALLPAFPILIVLGLSPLTLYMMGESYNPLTLGLSALVLGIGSEFTILILERYIEESNAGMNNHDAMMKSISQVGSAITVSGLTVIGGFAAIIFVSFPVLSSFGLITVLDTSYALLAALTIMPATVALIQKFKRMKTN